MLRIKDNIAGNTSTATKLQNARTINGTNFDGSANITTSNWGTSRTLTIGNTGKSINGSANISWSLSEIGAAASSHSHDYLPLSGGTLTGELLLPNGSLRLGTNSSSKWGFIGNNLSGTWLRFYDEEAKAAFNTQKVYASTYRIYHEGYKPTLTDLGATADLLTLKSLKFEIDRAWMFDQGGSGSTSTLDLTAQTDEKTFNICGINKTKKATFKTSSTYVDLWMDGGVFPNSNSTHDLGSSSKRWRTIYATNALSTSDKKYKENIKYILDKEISTFDLENEITKKDIYNFIKNDYKLSKYNYVEQEHEEFGFIAQDLANTKIGDKLIIKTEEGYMYSIGSYLGIIVGALQEEINLRDRQIEELRKEINTIKGGAN